MATETGGAFERAAETEHRIRTARQYTKGLSRYQYGTLAWARARLHSYINWLLVLTLLLGLHWLLVERVTNWTIAHAAVVALTFVGLVHAWGAQRVAEAELKEKNRE